MNCRNFIPIFKKVHYLDLFKMFFLYFRKYDVLLERRSASYGVFQNRAKGV